MIRKRILLLCLLCVEALSSQAQVMLTEQAPGRSDLPLVWESANTAVCYDAADAAVIEAAAELFAADVTRVTGREILVVDGSQLPAKTHYAILVGTVGQSHWIDELIAAKKIDVSAIEGGWERYVLCLVDRPGHGLRKVLVIAGRDRRPPAPNKILPQKKVLFERTFFYCGAAAR